MSMRRLAAMLLAALGWHQPAAPWPPVQAAGAAAGAAVASARAAGAAQAAEVVPDGPRLRRPRQARRSRRRHAGAPAAARGPLDVDAPPPSSPVAGARGRRASTASACTSAAMSCRSTSTRRGSRSSCWCRLSAPASTCRRRRPTRSSTSRSSKGFEVQGPFDPVWVTGTLKVTPAFTGLADAGYSLEAEKVEPRPGG